MRSARAILGRDRGWRRAVTSRGAALLNARWHKPNGIPRTRPCPACGDDVRGDDHAVDHAGELYHPGCALFSWERP